MSTHHVIQYRDGKFDAVMSGMGRNRGTLESAHTKRTAQRHAQQLRSENWRKTAGLSYRVETIN